MKICKLKLKNLNSFRKDVEIDFEKSPLNDASLVAITGPTGSGKTTLLDAICVALYGRTPRLSSGTGSQNPNHLISHGEKEGFAEVLFMANGTRYLAAWSAKQNDSPKGQLSYADDGKLISDRLSKRGKSLGSNQNTVSEEVESILGLDFDAFKRSVMLAQGEFAAFLKADLKDRRKILEKTAGIGIYNKLNDKLNEKEKEVREAYEHLNLQLDAISEASCEQIEADIEAAKDELDRLQGEDKALDVKRKRIQKDKELETKRKEDFDTLQSSEERQQELLDMQPKIDALQVEEENANRAQRLLPEKQAFDNAKSELEKVTAALSLAETEKTEAEEQVKTDQDDFDKKAKTYQDASDECGQQMKIYRDAKSDIERAEGQLAEAKKRDPGLADLDKQIDASESELTEKQAEQTQLQGQIDDAQRFLEDNPLPSNRQQRLTRTTRLLDQLKSEEKKLETELTNKANAKKKVSSLKKEIKKLSETQEERLSEKVLAKTTLADASTQLNDLLATGTSEEWSVRRQLASKAQPIAQEYEATQDGLADTENRLNTLNRTAAALDAELEQIETDFASQTEVCQQATEVVQRCQEEKEDARWADPINQLRQRLQPGEPCSVCGATEHPCADVVEPESEERIQHAEKALTAAKAESDAAQAALQTLNKKQIQVEQNKSNTINQIEACTADIETLQDEAAELLTKWQAIYSDTDVSSVWVSEQFDIADTAITDIGEAKQAHTQADNSLQMVSQHLQTCEKDIKREMDNLSDTETQLEGLNNTIADLQTNIQAIEARFWESMPDTFHGAPPKEAVNQFENKIEKVEAREVELRKAKEDLRVLNANIEAGQGKLQGLKDSREMLKNKKYEYLREGEAYLSAAREKTGGLDTEDDINEAIEALEADLQVKEDERGAAEKQLQSSRDLLIEKQATLRSCKNQHNARAEKFEKAHQTYSDRLKSEGFGLPEKHDKAFREEARIQEIVKDISEYIQEKHQLEVTIAKLQTQFKEIPFDVQKLGQITSYSEEIDQEIHEVQQQIWRQQNEIERLGEVLSKRKTLEDQIQRASDEFERWKTLKDLIGENKLFNFASTVILEQVNRLANGQLESLSSGRYQLKAEGIDDKLKLTIVDRWNANEERPVETLSGGESFLTSLALALALSELSRGRSQLNSLFLDEGFGTLDAETLDTAIAALEGLRMQGRNIFLISHIRELTRRLPVKIEVNKKGNGSSSVKIQG